MVHDQGTPGWITFWNGDSLLASTITAVRVADAVAASPMFPCAHPPRIIVEYSGGGESVVKCESDEERDDRAMEIMRAIRVAMQETSEEKAKAP